MGSGENILNLINIGFFEVKDYIRIILPTAPLRYITKFNKQTRSWYDHNNLGFAQAERYNE